ncbi:MAG: prolipoprotein diacylglyceryl transferase [Bacteroidales bacterium]|nr:prolipoprotein diacylglyceryl transferase [Bacteroidales bacterium]
MDLPVQTYGFFLALAFLISGLLLRRELGRKENEGLMPVRIRHGLTNSGNTFTEVLLSAILTAIIGFKVFDILLNYREFQLHPQQFLIAPRGNVTAALAFFVFSIGFALYQNYKLGKLPHEPEETLIHPASHTWSILIVAVISALIGSKLFDIFDNFEPFLRDPVESLTSFSGLTFYGGLITTVIVLIIYMRVIKLDWKYVIDATAPAIMLGYAIGRLGCHFSGDGCWGMVNEMSKPGFLSWLPDWAWAYNYPHNVLQSGIQIPNCEGSNCSMLAKPVWPTSLYESLISSGSFVILWVSRTRMKAPVTLFGLFMILNGVERFLIEKIRINHKYDVLGMQLTQAEIIAFFLIVGGIAVIVFFNRLFQKQQKMLQNKES